MLWQYFFIDFILYYEFPAIKDFLSQSLVENKKLELFYSLVLFFFLNYKNPLS